MATQVLVKSELEKGERVLEALDSARLPVRTAFWLYSDENWRLVLATSLVNERGPRAAYAAIQHALAKKSPEDVVPLRQIEVIPVGDPLIRAVNTAVKTATPLSSPVRFSNSRVANVFIEDAYIYRST